MPVMTERSPKNDGPPTVHPSASRFPARARACRACRTRRLDAEGDRTRTDVSRRRRDRLLHHVAQVAGHHHAALAGHHGGFDGEQLTANVGPGEPDNDADQVLALDLAVAELRYATISARSLAEAFTDFFSDEISSFIALRTKVESSRSRLRTPASRV